MRDRIRQANALIMPYITENDSVRNMKIMIMIGLIRL